MSSPNPLTKIQQLTISRTFMMRVGMYAQRVFLILFVALLGTLITAGAVTVVHAAVLAVGPQLTATKTDTLINDGIGGDPIDGKADPGETIRYTTTITNSAAPGPGNDATGVTFHDVIDAHTSLVGTSLDVSPLAINDTYDTVGNTLLDVSNGTPTAPVVHVAGSLFNNDVEFLGDTFDATHTHITSHVGPASGTLTLDNNAGTFTYLPNAGFTGTDSFTYTLTDTAGLTDTATVTINVINRVWYVKDDVAGTGTGRSTDPFKALASAAGPTSSPNDTIYVFAGDGAAAASQNAGFTLQTGQRLLGEGVALTVLSTINGVANPTLRAAGSQPQIGNTGGDGVTVSGAAASFSGVEIRGLNIAGSTKAINISTGSTFSGSFEVANNTIRAAGTNGIDVNGAGSGTMTVNLHDNTVTATTNGINIVRPSAGGPVNITAFDDNTITGSTGGTGISIVGTGGSILFDAFPGTAAFDVVSGGATVIGSAGAGNGAGTNALVLQNIRGDLSFSDLDAYADNGSALFINGTSSNYTGTSGTRVTANTNTPTLVATGGAALGVIDANINIVPTTFSSSITALSGVSLTRVSGTLTAPASSTITNTGAGGTGFFVNGGSNLTANVNVTYAGTITADIGRLVEIDNVTPTVAASYTFSGAITDNNDGDGGETGISLTGNTNATITFSGGLAIRTTTNPAFTASGGGTVNVSGTNSLTTTTGIAANLSGIGGGLTFHDISANGAVNGISLTNTTGSFTVTGNGSNDFSGGTIQNTTGDGVLLSNAQSISLTSMKIQNTANSGIKGSSNVQGFSFINGTINNSGTASGTGDSNIAFNKGAYAPTIGNEKNLTGTLTITGSTLTNAYYHGIDVYQFDGTISNFNISNNTITSSTSTATSKASAIRLVGFGSAATVANYSKGTISTNNITNFPSDAGILFLAGNGTSTSAPAGTYGSDITTNAILITNNTISGQSAANQMGTQGINTALNGRGTGDVVITNNSITNVKGLGIGIGSNGLTTYTAIITGNTINAHNIFASAGIGGGTTNTFASSDTPTLNAKIANNNISNTDGNGILMNAIGASGHLNVRILTNTVAAPINSPPDGTTYGIRVAAGNPSSADDAVCLDISANTTAGNNDGGGTIASGIGLRKQGTTSTINDFGIVGMAATSTPNVENYVNGLNPGSASGSFGVGGTTLISATGGFSSCSEPVTLAMSPANNHILAQAQPETNPMVRAEAVSASLTAAKILATAKTFTVAAVSGKASKQTAFAKASNTLLLSSNLDTGTDQLVSAVQPAPARSGGDIGPISIGTLPAGKSVTIQYDVTVDPLGSGEVRTRILNQGTVKFDPDPTPPTQVLTTDPSPNPDAACSGTSPKTCTPVDRPDTTVSSITRSVPATTPTNASSVTWAVTFAAPIEGLTAGNFALVNTGLTGSPAITGISPLSGPTNTWMVTASTGTGQGTLKLNMTSDTGLSHDITNGNSGTPFTTGEIYDIDHIAPTTVSITCFTPACINPTNAATLIFRVHYSEKVQNVGLPGASGDFTVTGGTSANTTNISSGNAQDFDVTVSGGDLATHVFNGTVGLGYNLGNLDITDDAGNALNTSTTPSPDETYTVDNIAPVVTAFTATSPTASLNIPITSFTATDTNGVTGYLITESSTPPLAGAAGWTASAPSTYTVVSEGTYTLYPWAKDAAGNVSAVFATPRTVVVDSTAPTVTAFTATSPSTSLNIPITSFTATDTNGVTGYLITESSTPPLTGAAGWTASAPSTYTVSSDGTYTLYPWAKDGAGNVSSVFATPRTVVVDSTAPTVTAFTATSPSGLIISITSFTATDSNGVTGYLITESSTPPLAGAAGWTVSAPSTYTVASEAIYTLYPWAKDAAGNVSSVFATPRTVVVDTTPPTVTAFTATSPSTSLNIPITSFTASDAVSVAGYLITESSTPPSPGAAGWTASAPSTYTVPSDGTYTLYPWAKDSADNVSSVFATPRTVVVDTTGPTVTDVDSTKPDGTYGTGVLIPVTVTFSEIVNVNTAGGTPTLMLETGTTDRPATYVSGSGTTTLTFNYTTQSGDTSADLDYVATNSLALNGGTIKDAATNNAVLTLPTTGIVGPPNSLADNRNIVIDANEPFVVSVSADPGFLDGSYKAGTIVPVTVQFSEIVNVNTTGGTPTLTLETGSTDAVVNYSSGTGTDTLTFNYTVVSGNNSLDLNYVSTTSLALNGGTIQDVSSNDAILTLPATGAGNSLAGNRDIVIDTIPPIKINNVTSSNLNGSYTTGADIYIEITYSENVYVTGLPVLKLETGATDRNAVYDSGSGTIKLVFKYTVQAGDTSADLDYFDANALTLPGGATIKDLAGNDAILGPLALPGTSGSLGASKDIVIDTTAPTVTDVNSTASNGAYTTGAVIPITVTFNEPVTVTGSPTLTLETGAIDEVATYNSGSSTATALVFDYTVVAGDTSADLNYLATNSLSGTIQDAATNSADLTLPALASANSLAGHKAIVIDTTAPTVNTFTATSPSASLNIPITAFTASDTNGIAGYLITVSSTPPLAGATGWTASAPTTYTVASDGTYTLYPWAKDAAGNVSPLFGSPATVVVDATAPTVTAFTATSPTASLNIPITSFTATDTNGVAGYLITQTSTPPLAGASGWTGSAPSTYTVAIQGSYTLYPWAKDAAGNVSPLFGSPATVLVDTTAPNTFIDPPLPSNPTNSTTANFTFHGTDNVGGSGVASFECDLDGGGFSTCASPQSYSGLSTGSHTFQVHAIDNVGLTDSTPDSYTWVVDITRPTVTINQASGQSDTTSTSPVHFTAVFSEPVTLFDATDVSLSGSANPTTATITPTSGPATTYDVAVSGMTTDGTITVSIPANSAKDAADNFNFASTTTIPGDTDTITNYIYAVAPIITEGASTSVTMSENSSPTPFSLMLHASDGNGDPLTWSIFTQGNYGTASAAPGPANSSVISYTPLPNYNGTDSFVVQVSDGGRTAEITVNVTIQPQPGHSSLIWNQSYEIQYDTWLGVRDPGAFGGGYRQATSGTFTFQPSLAFTSFKWITYRGPDQGKAQVLVDGVVKATVDLYRSTAQWQYLVTIGGLTNKKHTIVIKALNAKNAASSNKWVSVDGFKIGTKTYDDVVIYRSNPFSYGSWLGLFNSGARFGAYRISSTKNATIKFSFDGVKLTWTTARGPAYGKAAIYIDGVLKQTVDLYRASQQWNYNVLVQGLPYGHHDVIIKVLGTKNPHSSGISIICDGFTPD